MYLFFPSVKPISLLIIVLCLVLAAGCNSNKTRIDGNQFELVDTKLPKNVSLVLDSYRACAKADEECLASQERLNELQGKFEKCIARGLKQTAPDVNLIGKEDWNSALMLSELSIGASDEKSSSPDSLSAEHRSLLRSSQLDYLVSMGVVKRDSNKRGKFDSDQGLWAIGQTWTKSANIEARIYSIHSGALAGRLSASLSRDALWMLPVLVIIPLPPVGWSPNVESTSCREMGKALGRFFSGTGNHIVNSSST